MPELGPHGSVRGARSNARPYRGNSYVLMEALRRWGLRATDLAQAQVATMRLKLLKVGALIRVTVRKVWVSLAEGYPYAELFARAYAALQVIPLRG